jgi:hypothetical protein
MTAANLCHSIRLVQYEQFVGGTGEPFGSFPNCGGCELLDFVANDGDTPLI